jgi:hypothetical protein
VKHQIWRASLGSSTGSSLEAGRSPFGAASNARRGKTLVGILQSERICILLHPHRLKKKW